MSRNEELWAWWCGWEPQCLLAIVPKVHCFGWSCTVYWFPSCVEQFKTNFQPAFLQPHEFHPMQVQSNVLGLISWFWESSMLSWGFSMSPSANYFLEPQEFHPAQVLVGPSAWFLDFERVPSYDMEKQKFFQPAESQSIGIPHKQTHIDIMWVQKNHREPTD